MADAKISALNTLLGTNVDDADLMVMVDSDAIPAETKQITFGELQIAIGTKTNNDNAAIDPVATDDDSKDYSNGSLWINVNTDTAFICVQDTTNIAIWQEIGSGGGGAVDSVNGKTGIVVIDPDDLNDAATANKFTTAGEIAKLTGIESNATADQSNAEIKIAYEANANTNAYTDTEKTKAAGHEANSTADQTNLEIKTAYETNADTNEYSDAEQTKLSNIETAAELNTSSNDGAGSGIAKAKVGSNMPFKSLVGGTNVTLSSGVDTVTINATSAPVDSVNAQTGAVVLDADDLSDTTTSNKFTTAAEISKLAAIEALADVTDNANVNAAGAVMEADTTTATYGFVVDEDDMTGNSNTKVPTQQSVKAYVDARVASDVSYKGSYNASTNSPNLDDTGHIITTVGDMYTVTADGVFFTANVEIGDVLIAEIANANAESDWTIVNKNLDAASIKSSYESNADTNEYSDAEQTKVGHISVTQAVDLDTIESDTATNNAKTSNVTHTGEVTGDTTLTLGPTAISNKTAVTAVATDYVLIGDTSDANNLKKALVSDFLEAAADQSATQARKNTSTLATSTPTVINLTNTDIQNNPSEVEWLVGNPERITVKSTGLYSVGLGAVATNSATLNHTVLFDLFVNGITSGETIELDITKSGSGAINPARLVQLTANDYISIVLSQTTGSGDLTVEADMAFRCIKMSGGKGDTGANGTDGAAGDINWQGTWVSGNYLVNDTVEYNGSSYVNILNTDASQVPTNGTYWDLVAQKGTDGADGADGATDSIDSINGDIETPSDRTYTLIRSSAEAYTINTLISKMSAGTLTANVQIDGVTVTGMSALAITSTEGTATATALNSVAIGQTVTLVLSASATPADYGFTLKMTKV